MRAGVCAISLAGIAGLAGCFSPELPEGVSCAGSGLCPRGLTCDRATLTCVEDPPGESDAAPMDDPDASLSGVDAAVEQADAEPGPDAAPPPGVRMNINGPQVTGVDFPGEWQADPGSGGACSGTANTTMPESIQGTVDDDLFRGVMFDGSVHCEGPAPNGTYEVTLLFAEIYHGPDCPGGGGAGSRVFDIKIEGTPVLEDLDVFSEGNGCVAASDDGAHPISKTFSVEIDDGDLDLELHASKGNAFVSAIQILQP